MPEINNQKICFECIKYRNCSPDKIKYNLRDGRCGYFQSSNETNHKAKSTNQLIRQEIKK